MKNTLTAMELIEASERFEIGGNEFNTIEGYMTFEYGIDWDKNSIILEIYDFLKKSMYKDEKYGWIAK